jgi:alpha-L-fucosidase
VDIVSKNGALLLNIGPRPDGTIPEPEIELLRGVGQWLTVCGEAIYGTRPWRVYGEGPTKVLAGSFTDTARDPFSGQDIRFTRRGETLYAIALAWPDGDQLTVTSLGTNARLYAHAIDKVELLGHSEPLQWTRDPAGLTVTLPSRKPCAHAFALRITPTTSH